MIISQQDAYRQFSQEHALPVYARDWWWDAACGTNEWDACLVTGDAGKVLGALPFCWRRKGGLSVIQNPPLTAYQPLYLAPPLSDRRHRRYAEQKKIVQELLGQLPKAALIKWQLMPVWTNGLPFYWSGFTLGVRYTYRLRDLHEPAALLEKMEGSVRTNIRKARDLLEVQPSDNLHQLLALKQKSYRQKKEKLPFNPIVLERLHAAIQKQQAGKLFIATEKSGIVHAAAYVLWGSECVHYWLSAVDPDLKSSGAATLLLWEAVQQVSEKASTFDFEGSMEPGIEQLFRAFEAERVPYLEVFKAQNRWWKSLYHLWK